MMERADTAAQLETLRTVLSACFGHRADALFELCDAVLSAGVRVNSFSHVEQCVLLERVQVGRYARLRRVIVDKDVEIPQGMQIGFDLEEDRKRFAVTEDGMVVIPKRARLTG